MRVFKVSMLLFACFLLSGAILCVCSAQEVIDSTGICQAMFVSALGKKVPFLAPFAGWIYTIIVTALGGALWKLTQSTLKRIPTKWKWSAKVQDVVVSKIWTFLTWFFGKAILYHKMRIETEGEQEAIVKQAAMDKFKAHMLKHDPILSIDVNKLIDGK